MCDPRELRSRAVGANGRRRQKSKPNKALVTDNFTADNFLLKPGTNRLHQTMSSDSSPDSKCPICLDRFENVAYLDHCWHRFCFWCVVEWSKNKAECPLCKQPFHSILHSMRSEDDYQVYVVRPSEAESFANPNGRRFRYRTTLTGQSRTSGFPQRTSSLRRTVSPPDNGVLFEDLSSQQTRHRGAEMHQMMRRLASRRRASLEGRSMRQIQEQEMIRFRRALYRSGIRVRSIEDGGRYRDISAEFFRRNPACLHRLVPWLKRELTILFGARGSLVNIVQRMIMSNVTRHDLESQAFVDDLKPFLLDLTEHFLHEFISFARCPFNIEAYDQHANYDCPAPSREDGSRSESSIITISPDEADRQESEHNAFTSGIGQAPWDDETPGPSYSSSEQVCAAIPTALDTSESSDEEPSANRTALQRQLPASVETNCNSVDSPDNCVIVGYVKPLAERTPELVELSSDSEESTDGRKSEDVKKVHNIQYYNVSDTDASGYSSPFSIGSRDDRSSCKTVSPLSKIKSKEREKDKTKRKECGAQTLLQSSPTRRDDYEYKSSRKRKSDAEHSHSRERHGLKSKRKHRSMEKRKRKGEGSQHKHRKDKKRSRNRDKSLSRKSQALSLSSESILSRDLSRSRSHSNEYSKSRSESKDSDYYLRDNCQSRYQWDYAFYSRNIARDGYDTSYRKQFHARTHYSRQSASPDYRIQSFSEQTSNQYSRGHSESRYYYYERRRSRSHSSSRSRTPLRGHDRMRSEKPSGKRKYKTRHLENALRGSEEDSSSEEERALQKVLPKGRDLGKKPANFVDRGAEAEIEHKKRKKRSRSPSVEIIYEEKATDATKHYTKKRKREKKAHRSHMGYSPISSPVVITIDSDSDKSEIQDSTECDSSLSWSPTVQQNERDMESPSSLVETRDTSNNRADEMENVNMDSMLIPSTTREDVGDEIPNGVAQQQGTVSEHTFTVTGRSISFDTGNLSSGDRTEFCNRFTTIRTSLILRLRKKLIASSPPPDSPDQTL